MVINAKDLNAFLVQTEEINIEGEPRRKWHGYVYFEGQGIYSNISGLQLENEYGTSIPTKEYTTLGKDEYGEMLVREESFGFLKIETKESQKTGKPYTRVKGKLTIGELYLPVTGFVNINNDKQCVHLKLDDWAVGNDENRKKYCEDNGYNYTPFTLVSSGEGINFAERAKQGGCDSAYTFLEPFFMGSQFDFTTNIKQPGGMSDVAAGVAEENVEVPF